MCDSEFVLNLGALLQELWLGILSLAGQQLLETVCTTSLQKFPAVCTGKPKLLSCHIGCLEDHVHLPETAANRYLEGLGMCCWYPAREALQGLRLVRRRLKVLRSLHCQGCLQQQVQLPGLQVQQLGDHGLWQRRRRGRNALPHPLVVVVVLCRAACAWRHQHEIRSYRQADRDIVMASLAA